MRRDRVRAYRSGVLAEAAVALILRLKGHRIVAQRYKTPVGEIDLVALKGRRLAFIEVKRRKTREDAAWTLPASQRRRIVRAAQYWLAGHPALRRPRHGLRRGAHRALDLAALHRERISCLTPGSFPFGETLPIRSAMALKVAFQMDPIERIDIRGDSTFALLLEAQWRGHDVFYYTPANLSLARRQAHRRGPQPHGRGPARRSLPAGASKKRRLGLLRRGASPPGPAFRHGLYHHHASARAAPAQHARGQRSRHPCATRRRSCSCSTFSI